MITEHCFSPKHKPFLEYWRVQYETEEYHGDVIRAIVNYNVNYIFYDGVKVPYQNPYQALFRFGSSFVIYFDLNNPDYLLEKLAERIPTTHSEGNLYIRNKEDLLKDISYIRSQVEAHLKGNNRDILIKLRFFC